MISRYAHLPDIKGGVVFSDPWYDETVWCQYRYDFEAKNWLMKLDTKREDDLIFFTVHLGRPTMCAGVSLKEDGQDYQVLYPQRYDSKNVELGIDTARIYCGNKHNWNMAKEEAAIYTGADGLFGDLMVFNCKGEQTPAGYLLVSSVDASLTNEEDLFRTLLSCFDGKEITRVQYNEKTNENNLSFRLEASDELNHAKMAEKSITVGKEPAKEFDR